VKKLYFIATLLFLPLISLPLNGTFVTILGAEGEMTNLEISGNETVNEIKEMAASVNGNSVSDQVLVFGPKWFFQKGVSKGKISAPRNYFAEVSTKEFEDLQFIIKTLGFKSLPKIIKEKGSLEKAGDRIDHLHPLRFLLLIFSNEELLAGVHNIRNRSWVWGEFSTNLKNTLREEADKNNIAADQIQDFAAKLSLDTDAITSPLQYRQWDTFVDLLLTTIKRNSDSGKYDM
jgi:hypothetical protein